MYVIFYCKPINKRKNPWHVLHPARVPCMLKRETAGAVSAEELTGFDGKHACSAVYLVQGPGVAGVNNKRVYIGGLL